MKEDKERFGLKVKKNIYQYETELKISITFGTHGEPHWAVYRINGPERSYIPE